MSELRPTPSMETVATESVLRSDERISHMANFKNSENRANTHFDAIAHAAASGVSRRSVLKSIAGGLASAAIGACWRGASAAAESTPAGGTVYLLYQAIARRDYRTAYRHLGGGFTARHSYADFVQGYSNTAYVDLNVTNTTTILEKNQVNYAVTLTAWRTDGSIVWFKGSYTEGREGGALKIVDSTLTESPARGVAPLCNAADFSLSATGDARPGQRYSTVTAVNHGNACVMGATPGMQIYDVHRYRIVAGKLESGSAITTVTLARGDSAKLTLDWSNWCGPAIDGPYHTKVQLPAGRGFWTGSFGPGVPPCLGAPDSASRLTFKPWVKA